MKYYLFIDNFRGFSNTYIPITEVNFLVGENSTGKTSVLALIKQFAGPQVLFRPAFSDEHVPFGHFSDMVSAHADDRSYFRIGLIWQQPRRDPDKPERATGLLFTFVPDEGLPRFSRVTFSRGSDIVSLQFRENGIFYKRTPYGSGPPTVQQIVKVELAKWAEEQQQAGSTGYTKLSLPPGVSIMPIVMILSWVWGLDSQKVEKKVEKKGESPDGAVPLSFIFESPDVLLPPDVVWVAPIRTKPKRTYDELMLDFSPEGAHTPYVIRRLLQTKSRANKFRDFIRRVGEASGLFQDVRIKSFGNKDTGPFEVDIVIDNKALNLNTVGYGVSQSLPVFVEAMARDLGSWFAIQQPEVHLHPKAQAALGDVFFEMASTERKVFLIETHSDFTIDRFRMNYKQQRRGRKPDSQILFFERRDRHNVVTSLPIDKTGALPSDQPESYREFFIKEDMRLLGL